MSPPWPALVLCAVALLALTVDFSNGSTVLVCGSDSYDPSNGGTMFRRLLDDLAVDYELLPSLAVFPADLSMVAGLQLVIVTNECADPAQIEASKLLVTAVPVLVAKANVNLLDKVGISEFGVVSIATVASATALVPADDPLNAGLDTDPVSFGNLTFGTVPVANLPGGARVVLSPSDDPSSAIMVAVEAGEPLFLASAVGTRLFFAPTTDAVPGVGDPSGYARAAIGWLLRRLVIHPVVETVLVGQPFEVDFDIVDVDGNPDAVTWGVSDVRFGLSVRSGASLSVIRSHRGFVGRDGGSFSFIITDATSDSANLTMWCSGAADVTSCHRSVVVPLLVTAVQPQELAIHSVLPASLAANVGGDDLTITGAGLDLVVITVDGVQCIGPQGDGTTITCSCCGSAPRVAGPPGPVDLVITDNGEVADFPMHFLAVPTPSEVHVTPAMVHVDTDGGLKIEIYTAGNGSLGASASDVEAVNYGGVDILSLCTFDGLPEAVVCTLPVDLGSHGDEVALTIDLIHADPIMVPIKVVGSPVIDSVDYEYTTATLTLGLTNGVPSMTDIVTELVRAEDGTAFPCSTVSTNPVETTCTAGPLPLPASGSHNYYPRVTTPGGTAISRTLIPVTPQVTTVSVSQPNNVVGGIFRITDTTAVIECSSVAHSCDPDNVESITVNGMPVDIVSSDGSGFTVNMTKAMLSSAGDVVFDVFLFSDYRAGVAEPAVVAYVGAPTVFGLGFDTGRATGGPFYHYIFGQYLGSDMSITVDGAMTNLVCVSSMNIGFEYSAGLSGTVDVVVIFKGEVIFTSTMDIDDNLPYVHSFHPADTGAHGSIDGGDLITIQGFNLDYGVTNPNITMPGGRCVISAPIHPNNISCYPPPQPAGGTAQITLGFTGYVFATMPCLYTFHEPPVVTSASNAHPVGVPVEVSTHIYFGGDETLNTPLDVLVGGYACISVSYSSDTNQVACELPTSFPVDVVKSYNVTVVTPGGVTTFEGAFNVTDQLAFPETVSLSHSDDGQPWNVTLPGHFLGNGNWIFGSHTCVYLEDAVNGIVCEFAGGVAVGTTTGVSADGREMAPGWPSWYVTIFAQPELLSVDRMPGTDDIALTVRGDDYNPITGVQIDGQTCTNFEYHVYFPITDNVITCTPPVLPDPTVADISFSVTAGGGDFGTDGQRNRYYRGVVPASVVSPLGGSPIPSYQPTNLTLAVAPEFFAEDADQIVTVRVGGEKCDVVEVIDGDSVGVSSLTCTVPGRSAASAANTSVEIATVWGEALFDLGTSFESCQAGADAIGGNCAACMSMAPACGWCAEAETCEASGACIAATVCPTVDSIDIVTGPSEGRTLVTVNVVNATVLSETGTRCLIDGQEVVPEAVTATGVECLTPAHAAGTVSVQLTTAAGDLVDANGVDFAYYDCSAMHGTCRACAADARCGWCERAGACAGATTGACGDDIVGAAGSCPTAVSLSSAFISTDINAEIVVDVTGFGPSREPILCAYSSLPSGPANVSARFVSPTQVACPAVPGWTSVAHGGTFGVRLVKASDPNYGGGDALTISAAVCSSLTVCTDCESIDFEGACVWCRDDDSCVGAHAACAAPSCPVSTAAPTTGAPTTSTAPTTHTPTTDTTTAPATTSAAGGGGPTPDRPFEGLSGTIGCETTRSCVTLVPNVTTPHCHNGTCLLLEIACVDNSECPPESGLTCRSRNGTTLCLSPCLIEDDDRTVLLIIMLGAVGGLTVILTLAALIGRWKIKAAEGSNVWVILAIGIAVGDLVSDIFFVTGLAGVWFWIGASALALPTLVNIIVIGVFWAMEVRSTPSMVTYNEKYTTPAAAIMILSLVNLEALGLLTSRIFGVKALDAPFSPRGQTILRFGRLTNTIFEDCVQLALVVMVTRECSDWELVGLLSVCFGVLSVVMTLFTRFMFCIGRCTVTPASASATATKPTTANPGATATKPGGTTSTLGGPKTTLVVMEPGTSSTSGTYSSTSGSSSSSSSGSST